MVSLAVNIFRVYKNFNGEKVHDCQRGKKKKLVEKYAAKENLY